MTASLATIKSSPPSLVEKFAGRFGIDADKLLPILKSTAFRQRKDTTVITNEQMAALLIVADQYGLNPFTKEIYAFEDKGAIVPVVSVDGWSRIINEHKELDGIEFAYDIDTETMVGAKPCPTWCEVIIHRKDRTRPTVVREYLDEVYVPPRNSYSGPWQSHTKRMLRHKTLIQGSRVAFGFAGIYDEDEAKRIVEAETKRTTTVATSGRYAEINDELAEAGAQLVDTETGEVVDAEFTERGHLTEAEQEADAVDLQRDGDTGEVLPPEYQE